jgi:hypothetical protein
VRLEGTRLTPFLFVWSTSNGNSYSEGATMGLNTNMTRQNLFNDARLAWLMDSIDELHTAIADGELANVTTLSEAEVVGILHELIYTAHEALDEIEAQRMAQAPRLKLIRKSS